MGRREWAKVQAPTAADLEALAASAWQRIPRLFRDVCGDVVIRIEDFATEEVLRDLGLDSPFDLMGLYQGISLNRKSVLDSGSLPSQIYLYRRPILDYWAEHGEPLGHIVAHVLIHEIGHHFGFSDADMAQIEAEARD
jgi:predicted Zn-dependent protease with MMP-like domain